MARLIFASRLGALLGVLLGAGHAGASENSAGRRTRLWNRYGHGGLVIAQGLHYALGVHAFSTRRVSVVALLAYRYESLDAYYFDWDDSFRHAFASRHDRFGRPLTRVADVAQLGARARTFRSALAHRDHGARSGANHALRDAARE